MFMSFKENPTASQKKAGRERGTTSPLVPQEKPGLQRKGSTSVQALDYGHASSEVVRKQPNEYVK